VNYKFDGSFWRMVLNKDERLILENLIYSRMMVLTEVSHAYKQKKSKGHILPDTVETQIGICNTEIRALGGLLDKLY
jgi:hypothetical protein